MSKIPNKVVVSSSISMDDKVKLDILKEKSFIKNISDGIRRAVNDMLKKPEVVIKLNEDVNQKRIIEYGKD